MRRFILNNIPLARKVVNGMIFYAAYFAAVVGAAQGSAMYGTFICLGMLGVHLLITPGRTKELLLMSSLALAGLAVDTTYLISGVLRFTSPNILWEFLAPPWIIVLYAVFATSIDHSLIWLGLHPLLAALVGGFGGAFSYLVGAQLGACTLLMPNQQSLIVIAITWAVLTPLSFWYARWLGRKLRG